MVVSKRSKITAKVSRGHSRVVFTKDENKDEITAAHEQLFGLVSAEFCVIFSIFRNFLQDTFNLTNLSNLPESQTA